jgi:hypothetical protein
MEQQVARLRQAIVVFPARTTPPLSWIASAWLARWAGHLPQSRQRLLRPVTYHNPDNGYCVLRVKVRGHRELVTVLGHAASISAGEFVQALTGERSIASIASSSGTPS